MPESVKRFFSQIFLYLLSYKTFEMQDGKGYYLTWVSYADKFPALLIHMIAKICHRCFVIPLV